MYIWISGNKRILQHRDLINLVDKQLVDRDLLNYYAYLMTALTTCKIDIFNFSLIYIELQTCFIRVGWKPLYKHLKLKIENCCHS